MIYFGVIEDKHGDALLLCRYKVRIIGVHSPSKADLKTSDLPWATPIQSNSAAMSGIGTSATGYLQGTTVAVLFLDTDKQQPVILGAIGGIPTDNTYSPSLFDGLVSDLKIIPPQYPPENIVRLPNGSSKPISQVTSIPDGAVVEEQPYIGSLTKSDIVKLSKKIAELRQNNQHLSSDLGIGKYQHTPAELNSLGYLDDNYSWTGLNKMSSEQQYLDSSGTQDDSEEILLKLNYTSLCKFGIASDSMPREKLAGLLAASQVTDTTSTYQYVDTAADVINDLGESVSSFYKAGYVSITGKSTVEEPTKDNLGVAASDKFEPNTDPNKSKYDVKDTPVGTSNQGFTDPDSVYPLPSHKNEPDTPRLTSGLKINETIVGFKENFAIKSVSIANSSVKWKQSPIPYNARYAFNNVYQSASGHVMEFDDTPGAERINLHHKSGTFWEVDNVGNAVDRTMGIRTIIVDKDELVYIKGSGHITIDGDLSLKVNKAINIEVTNDVNIRAKNVNYEVSGDVNFKVGGSFNIDAANKIYLNSGNSKGLSGFFPTITLPAPVSRKEQQMIELEDMSYTTSQTDSPKEIKQVNTDKPAARNEVKAVNILPDEITYQTRLSANYIIKDMCVGVGSAYPFNGQHSKTAKQLADNLKALCLNCLEPIRAEYKDVSINSGIRPAGNPYSQANKISQHELGQAADLGFPSAKTSIDKNKGYYDIAVWIKNNILFDQLLLEYKGSSVWIHISFNTSGNRQQVLTLLNDRTHNQGLALL